MELNDTTPVLHGCMINLKFFLPSGVHMIKFTGHYLACKKMQCKEGENEAIFTSFSLVCIKEGEKNERERERER